MSLTREEAKKIVKEKGLILGFDYRFMSVPCTCKCRQCGFSRIISAQNIRRKQFIFQCVKCDNIELKALFAAKGMIMIKEDKRKKYCHPIEYICRCGKEQSSEHNMVRIKLNSPKGFSKCKTYGEKEVRDFLKERGCSYIEGTFTTKERQIQYFCVCGEKCTQRPIELFAGCNACGTCIKQGKLDEEKEKVLEWLEDRDDTFLQMAIVDDKRIYSFLCSVCDEEHTRTWKSIKQNHDVCPMRIADKMQSSRFELIPYTFKETKRTVEVLGYEPFCLNWLILHGIKEDDIDAGIDAITRKMHVPRIKYQFEGSEHTYTPDIFIKSKKILIEVKSPWTFEAYEDKTMVKLFAASMKFKIYLMIFGREGELITKRKFLNGEEYH